MGRLQFGACFPRIHMWDREVVRGTTFAARTAWFRCTLSLRYRIVSLTRPKYEFLKLPQTSEPSGRCFCWLDSNDPINEPMAADGWLG